MLSSFITPIWLYPQPIDFRKQIDGLVLLIADHLQLNPVSGQLFLFRNRGANKIKLLWWDRNGFWLCYKRLEKGRLRFPSGGEEVLELSRDRFGKKSERFIDPESRQLSLFDDKDKFVHVDSVSETAEDTTPVAEHVRKKKTIKLKKNYRAVLKLFRCVKRTNNVPVVRVKRLYAMKPKNSSIISLRSLKSLNNVVKSLRVPKAVMAKS